MGFPPSRGAQHRLPTLKHRPRRTAATRCARRAVRIRIRIRSRSRPRTATAAGPSGYGCAARGLGRHVLTYGSRKACGPRLRRVPPSSREWVIPRGGGGGATDRWCAEGIGQAPPIGLPFRSQLVSKLLALDCHIVTSWNPSHRCILSARELVLRLWPFAERILGAGCVLEPSFTAFQLEHARDGGLYVGQNFGELGRLRGNGGTADLPPPNSQVNPTATIRLRTPLTRRARLKSSVYGYRSLTSRQPTGGCARSLVVATREDWWPRRCNRARRGR